MRSQRGQIKHTSQEIEVDIHVSARFPGYVHAVGRLLTSILDPKKGAKCHRMLDCGHVFCIECLQDFYNNAIKEGDLASVRCLEPSCAKKREVAQAPGSKKRRKPKTYLSPSELLQIPLDSETVRRYVTLKYKTELESDKNVIYCPREGCHGAAKSKKHKKPEGFELHETEEDSEPEDEQPLAESSEAPKSAIKPFRLEDRLAVCEDCGFAFCSRCYKGWHGDYVICHPSRGKEELSEEEKASLDFISLHTTPCPTCACPAQKTQGCNHMYVMRQLRVSTLTNDHIQDLLQVSDALLLPMFRLAGSCQSLSAF